MAKLPLAGASLMARNAPQSSALTAGNTAGVRMWPSSAKPRGLPHGVGRECGPVLVADIVHQACSSMAGFAWGPYSVATVDQKRAECDS